MTVRLEPLDPSGHAEALFEALHGPANAELWTYLRDAPCDTPRHLAHCLGEWTALPHVTGIVFRCPADDQVIGMGGLIRRPVAHHASLPDGAYIELASIIFRRDRHGREDTKSGARALVALAFAAPDIVGCLWRCDVLNIASDRFARKLGFAHYGTGADGTSKGRFRQSHYYRLDRRDAF